MAVILAGGGAGDPLALHAGVAAKAHVPLGGRPMVSYVIAALRASRFIGPIVYVGEPPSEVAAQLTRAVPAGQQFVESLRAGCEAALTLAEPGQRLLLITADLPWLTADAIDHLLAHAPQAALVYTIIAKATAEAQFPAQPRTFVRLRGGVYTGGNAVVVTPDVIPRLLPLMERVYQARKRPLVLAGLVGWGTLLKVALRRATLSELEARVSRLLGASARAFETPHASIGADLDRPSQLASYASSVL